MQYYNTNHICKIDVWLLRRKLMCLSSLRNLTEPFNVHGHIEHNPLTKNVSKIYLYEVTKEQFENITFL